MTSFEYALRNFDEPSLFQTALMCRSQKEMLILDACLGFKRAYSFAIRSFSKSNEEKDRDYWSKVATRCGSGYLENLKKLEVMQ